MSQRLAWHGLLLLPALLMVLLLSGCGARLYKQQAYVFGTLVEITVYGVPEDQARQATDLVLREFDRMHRELHAWEPSPLETVNAQLAKASPAHPVRVTLTPELAEILSDARRLSLLSEGLFDPALGDLIRLWGFHTDTFLPRLPDPAEVERLARAHPGMGDLTLNGLTLTDRNPAVRLDLGGYAKGLALDRAAAILKRQGVDNALINIGGNILALGSKGGQAWEVGIQHPRHAGALATLELHDGEAIGTSGDYQRFFEVAGKRYCHLIDPRNGRPADQAQAVTVIASGDHAGTLSDVASKPLFIAGPNDWRRMAKIMGIEAALFVAADGTVSTTPAMQARLTWEPAKPVGK